MLIFSPSFSPAPPLTADLLTFGLKYFKRFVKILFSFQLFKFISLILMKFKNYYIIKPFFIIKGKKKQILTFINIFIKLVFHTVSYLILFIALIILFIYHCQTHNFKTSIIVRGFHTLIRKVSFHSPTWDLTIVGNWISPYQTRFKTVRRMTICSKSKQTISISSGFGRLHQPI